MKEPIDILYDELDTLKRDLIAKYKELNMRASGQWENALRVEVAPINGGGLRGIISGADYTYYMQHGRKAGKMPPIQAIEQWILARGIRPIQEKMNTNALAWAIAKKIARDGTKRMQAGGTPAFIDAIITPERVQQIIEKVGYNYVATFTSEIINFLNEMGK